MHSEAPNLKDTTVRFLSDPTHVTAALATADGSGVPHAAAIYFYADEELNFFFLTPNDTQKYKNLVANPTASLAVGLGPEYVTIETFGTTTLLEKGSEAENFAIANLKKRLVESGSTWPIYQLSDYDDDAIAVFKFVPSALYYLNLEKDNGMPVSEKKLAKVI